MVTATKKAPAKTAPAKPAAKPVAAPKTRPAAKPVAAQPVAQAPAKASKPSKPAKPPKLPKAPKPVKPKLERDRFTMLATDFEMLGGLKQRAARLKFPVKKSDVLRACIKALAGLSDSAFLAGLKALPALKTGKKA